MQLGFYFNQSRCTDCLTCVVACKDWHDVPAGPASWIRIRTSEKGKFPDLSVSHVFMTCYHCADAPCVDACPVTAIIKREEDGIVTVDSETCLGFDGCGGACKIACPYDAPQFRDDTTAKMEKCNLCLDRWAEGKKPVCVMACPTRALDAGPMDELSNNYGNNNEAEGFTYVGEAQPSIIIKSITPAKTI